MEGPADLITDVVGARERTLMAGSARIQVVRGTPCRHLRVAVDAGRASKATPGGVPVPSRPSFEELLALPMEVWIDDSHLRRVHFRSERNSAETMELWDFGQPIDEQDWLHLPTFQTPED